MVVVKVAMVLVPVVVILLLILEFKKVGIGDHVCWGVICPIFLSFLLTKFFLDYFLGIRQFEILSIVLILIIKGRIVSIVRVLLENLSEHLG